MNVRLAALLAFLAAAVCHPLRAETAGHWIAKARAYLGSEEALNSVSTIHFSGMLEVAGLTPAADVKSGAADMVERFPAEIVFQKPYQQQMTVTRPTSIDSMVLDDYDGWSRTVARDNPKAANVTLLETEQIKQLRANTWEILSFHAGLEKRGGTVQVDGEDEVVDGILCAKVSFVHSERIVFHRYFDKATGRLVKTETANGSEIREEGEIIVDGIRFPKRIVNKAPSGQVTTIVVEKVVLNEPYPSSAFAVPSLTVE